MDSTGVDPGTTPTPTPTPTLTPSPTPELKRAAPLGYLMALSAGCLWATLVVLGKRLVGTGADPIVLVGVRAALAFILLGAGLAVANRRLLVIRARDIPFFLLYGVTVAANYGFYFVALKHTTGTMAVLLTYTYPAMLAAMAAIFLGERLDRVKVLALVFTLGGCVLVAQAYNPGAMRVNWKGVLAGLGCALGGATYAAVSKSAVGRYNSWTLVLWGFGFGAAVLLGLRAGALGTILRFPGPVWGGLLVAALLPTLLAYVLFTRALVYVEVTRVCITASIEPVVAAGLAWAFLGERMGGLQWLGAAGVLAGVFLVQAADLRRSHRRAGRRDRVEGLSLDVFPFRLIACNHRGAVWVVTVSGSDRARYRKGTSACWATAASTAPSAGPTRAP